MDYSKQLRKALGRFATGICVVMVESSNGGFRAMTINSFSSVSLEPSLVLWSLKKQCSSYTHFNSSKRYIFNILSEHQKDVSDMFAKYGDHLVPDECLTEYKGVPVIKGAVAYFEAESWSTIEAGDHDILISSVKSFEELESELPLVFYGGSYRKLIEA